MASRTAPGRGQRPSHPASTSTESRCASTPAASAASSTRAIASATPDGVAASSSSGLAARPRARPPTSSQSRWPSTAATTASPVNSRPGRASAVTQRSPRGRRAG
ncbi:hypothetical protein ACFQY4_12285 [Catellatospora bangladeshensis]|uniref:hypothetical protein n=1 Tax=Catellatospora bangladeshensis TaxID=310355 RepID=UPI00361B136B